MKTTNSAGLLFYPMKALYSKMKMVDTEGFLGWIMMGCNAVNTW